MDNLIAWNVRGLNRPHKQKEVHNFLLQHGCGLACLVETKIKPVNFSKVYGNMFQNWCVTSNFHLHKGGRILVAWLDKNFSVNVKFCSSQCIHMMVHHITYKSNFLLTVVYGFNDAEGRDDLWRDMKSFETKDTPWLVVGDFNCPLNYDDRIGSDITYAELKDFRETVDFCNIFDMAATGARFTWSNKQMGSKRVMSKLDRSLINNEWLNIFPNAVTCYLQEVLYDHSPAVVKFVDSQNTRKPSFKFCDMWCLHPQFLGTVQMSWRQKVSGVPMYRVMRKLKELKGQLKELNKKHFNKIEEQYHQHLTELRESQQLLHAFPADPIAADYEHKVAESFKGVKKAYGSFLMQRAKINWLKFGDDNTKVFHQAIKTRQYQQRVVEIIGIDGVMRSTPESIEEAFELYYQGLLGSKVEERSAVQKEIVHMGPLINQNHTQILMQEVTDEEIKKVMFSIPGSKAPGPDGFNSTFFKSAWSEVGTEVCEAIKDFFRTGKMLKALNCTKLTLIPKVSHPTHVTEFRPIACCNTVYKCITKLLCARLKKVLPDIISPNQSGFVEGRQIVHNVSIIQDLVGMYNRKSSPPGCLLKIDIRKAFDSVQWDFLQEMLTELMFPQKFIDLVMSCVTTPWFSLVTNGNTHGFFPGMQGLRQGDPISPFLFVICMEYLSRLLKYAGGQAGYQYHYRCKGLKLNHLVFADDLILFCKGDKHSVMLNMRALATFANTSGLVANSGKSALYACNMDNDEKQEILSITGFVEDHLPFKYLGVKISARKLSKADCEFMADKIASKIRTWGSRNLSYAGRAQLVNVVLLNMHGYWASMFFLPKKVIEQVVAMCRNYLWTGQVSSSKPAPIAWDLVCRSRKEGGLGFKESAAWNLALLGKYVWCIASKADNLWVKWVNHVYLRGQDWKTYSPPSSASWYWKNLCKVKDVFREGYTLNKWKFSKTYNVSSGYNWVRGEGQKVDWSVWVWSRLNIPRSSFISWLIMWNRIQTKNRLKRFGVVQDDLCYLCECNSETIDHLFFECGYARMCWNLLLEGLQLNSRFNNVSELDAWLQKPVTGRVKATVIRSCVTALLYNIWRQRNEACWNKALQHPAAVVRTVKSDCWHRISGFWPRKTSQNVKDWCKHILC